MTAGDVIAHITEGLVALGVPGGAVWYVRDRRKSRAEAQIAERTADSQVELADTGAAEARLAYVQQQMDLERNFHTRQVADRDAEIARQRAELEHRDQVIAELRSEIDDLQRSLTDAMTQLASLRNRVVELADHPSTPSPRQGRQA